MSEKKWFAIYTRSRNEKKVAERLEENSIEVYLPLLHTLKQWSDRKKKITIPLFKGYVFVHIDSREYIKVLHTEGVVRFVTIGNELIPIPENQIMAIKYFLQESDQVEGEKIFNKGDRVVITHGALMGIRGDIMDFSGKHKVRIKIEVINQYIDVSIPASLLTRIQ